MVEPVPERRRELLNELTGEAGTYGEPAPEMRPPVPERTPPDDTTEGEER